MSAIMKNIRLILVLVLFGLSNATLAESLSLSKNNQNNQTVNKPSHGQSMQQVESVFGQPLEKSTAVGTPPITKWRFALFTVYFEHDLVIHSVNHRS